MPIFYWEKNADAMRARGWSLAWTKHETAAGTEWQVDASRQDGRHLTARAEKLTVAFIELDKMTREADPVA